MITARVATVAGYRETLRRRGITHRTAIGRWWPFWLASLGVEALATALGVSGMVGITGRTPLDALAGTLLLFAGTLAQVAVGEVDDAVGGSSRAYRRRGVS